MTTKIIAYYLPQYHPIKENNDWWGEGFTEWTNVGKAKPLFRGHDQPKVPMDLGYYDLRIPEVREAQAKLAREFGVTGFCYWHYWFGNKKRLLDMPINQVLKSGRPDFPFCLGWANESWKAKAWKNISSKNDRILIEQTYPSDIDIVDHFKYVFKFVKDKRYMRFNGRPIFVVYKPLLMPEAKKFILRWNEMIKGKGFDKGFYFIGHTINEAEINKILDIGFDAVNIVRIGEHRNNKLLNLLLFFKLFFFKILGGPLKINYKFISRFFLGKAEACENVIPTMIPNWDHTPRSGRGGIVFNKSTPQLFYKHVCQVINLVKNKNNKIIFIKSWNEWGEGNYLEPDIHFGQGYLVALKKALNSKKLT